MRPEYSWRFIGNHICGFWSAWYGWWWAWCVFVAFINVCTTIVRAKAGQWTDAHVSALFVAINVYLALDAKNRYLRKTRTMTND